MVCVIVISSLLVGAVAADIQFMLGFIDGCADRSESIATAGAANGNAVGADTWTDAESEVMGNYFLQPHLARGHDGVSLQGGEHGHLLRALSVAVDEGVISDLGHGLHRLSIQIQKAILAVSQGLSLCGEHHGTETMLHFPDVPVLVLRDRHRLPLLGLEQHLTFVIATGEAVGVFSGQPGFTTVENSSNHVFSSFVLLIGDGLLGDRCVTSFAIRRKRGRFV
jgi:hypothetical protein